MRNPAKPDRRGFLGAGAAALLLRNIPAPRFAEDRRLLLVILGGGVRSQDTLEGTAMPSLQALAAAGTLLPTLRIQGRAAEAPSIRTLLTGVQDDPATPAGERPATPTLLEAFRRESRARSDAAWLLAHGQGPAGAFAGSSHPDGGPDWEPTTILVDRLFSGALQASVRAMGVPVPEADAEAAPVERATERLFGAAAPTPAPALALADLLVRESHRGAADAGPGITDRRILRTAEALVRSGTPRLIVAALHDAVAADEDHAVQLAILKRTDAAVAALVQAIDESPGWKDAGTLALCADTGRNRKAAPDGRLGRDEGGAEVARSFLVLKGPAVKPGQVLKSPATTADVAPTLAALLGFRMAHARGRPLRAALR